MSSLGERLASIEDSARVGLASTWSNLLRPNVTHTDYAATLLTSYGFIAPLESACRYTPSLARTIESRGYTNAGLIAQDLLFLGLRASQLTRAPQCRAITTFGSSAEALGWLYVVRSTAGAYLGVHRHLLSNLPGIDQACTYLTAMDAVSWEMFDGVLDRLDPQRGAEMVEAATLAFDWAGRWVHDTHSTNLAASLRDSLRPDTDGFATQRRRS